MHTSEKGLEDVVAAQSAITWIDGDAGQLRYRGYAIGDLAANCSFEEVAYLLWHGEAPAPAQLLSLRESLRTTRMACAGMTRLMVDVPACAHPLDVLRYVVSWDALQRETAWDNAIETNQRQAMAFTAWFPLVVTALHRLRAGQQPVLPPPDLDTAAAFLFGLTGREPSEIQIKTLNTSLILHADHELNASTFAARVTIATQSNLHAAVASALGTLAGPRHGGASDQVIHMLRDIGTLEAAEDWVAERLARKQRIMGFGHRVYRTIDPRSRHLRAMAEQLLVGTPQQNWLEILDVLASIMEREKSLYPNVDLYAAIVNHALGIEPAFYTSIFACSRIVGWTAHAIEQLDGRMIRPVAEYVGPEPRSLRTPAAV